MNIGPIMKPEPPKDMTESDWRALEHLCSYKGLIGPGAFGDAMWGRRGRGGSNCSCPYARQAGKVLNRLRACGFAEWEHVDGSWGWSATSSGRAAAASRP